MSSLKRKGKVQVEETRDKNNRTEHEDFFLFFILAGLLKKAISLPTPAHQSRIKKNE